MLARGRSISPPFHTNSPWPRGRVRRLARPEGISKGLVVLDSRRVNLSQQTNSFQPSARAFLVAKFTGPRLKSITSIACWR